MSKGKELAVRRETTQVGSQALTKWSKFREQQQRGKGGNAQQEDIERANEKPVQTQREGHDTSEKKNTWETSDVDGDKLFCMGVQ